MSPVILRAVDEAREDEIDVSGDAGLFPVGVARGAEVEVLAVMEWTQIEDWHVSALSSWAVSTAAGGEMEPNSCPLKTRKGEAVSCRLPAFSSFASDGQRLQV